MNAPRTIIDTLGLAPHPEGGWYRETWRAPAEAGRSAGTAIHFLLEQGQRSHWHRVDADELWLWHAGSPLELCVEQDDGAVRAIVLGGDVIGGEARRPGCRRTDGNRRKRATAGRWSAVSLFPAFPFRGSRSPRRSGRPTGYESMPVIHVIHSRTCAFQALNDSGSVTASVL